MIISIAGTAVPSIICPTLIGRAGHLATLHLLVFPLLPELAPDQPIALPLLEPEQEKRRLFAVMATFFIHLSTHSPVLLIIEDVHWSDDISLDFLRLCCKNDGDAGNLDLS